MSFGKKELKLRNYKLPIGEHTCVMGVLNVTPDSFSDGGKYFDLQHALEKAKEMVSEGADIIDIGGESSRPGSKRISIEEELKRVIPVVKALRSSINIPISIDTSKSEVAREALIEGVSAVNDITALKGDPRMAKVISEFGAGALLMHMQGTPQNMQNNPFYQDVISEIKEYLKESIALAEESGISGDSIAIDPGIGFGKTLQNNITIIRELKELEDLGKPILIGTSRKSFIGELTGKDTNERTFGTAATLVAAIMNGANIVRVHDVLEMRDVINVTDAIIRV